MRLTESILTKLNESTWCGVPNTIYRYHGNWSDPEVEYKGKLYNEWDLQEYIGEIFNVYCKENNIDIKNDWTEKFGDWLSKNPDYAYDAFEVLEPVEIVRNDLGDRVKRSRTSNTIEIDTKMTNHDKQLDEYGNSGYIGHSKSVRARGAEEEEKYPATECDKLLGIRSGATKDVLAPCEWHHTGSYYNETNYYDIRLLMALKDNDAEIISEYDQDEIDKAKKQWEELKSWRKPEVESETFKANVEWLTWSGTRKHPKATRHYVSNVDVTKRGSYYYFKDEDGYDTKKMIGSNGTNVTRIDRS